VKRLKVRVKRPKIEEALLRAQRIAHVTITEGGTVYDVMNVFYDKWYYFVVLANGIVTSYMPICKQ
jgi:hypothetical protein